MGMTERRVRVYANLLDLWGLASLETAVCIIDHTMPPEIAAELAAQKHSRVALIL